jgi:hypothetical protein
MRLVHRTFLLALLGLVIAGAAGALLVATAQSSPVFGVNWHFSVVNKHYSSRVGEFLATGEGVMDFNNEVISGAKKSFHNEGSSSPDLESVGDVGENWRSWRCRPGSRSMMRCGPRLPR